ncbi:MAG TPA: hypothetical protein VGE52_00115, partial [Pirellulales bacterium]
DRIWNHPEYLLFGAGEGAYTRFHSHINLELHSSLGTLLFCYGLIGLLLFFRTIAVLVRDCGWRVLWYFAPAMAYGLTHNGLRQTEFWLIAVLIVCIHARTTKSINARESHVNFTPSSTMRREIQTIQTL